MEIDPKAFMAKILEETSKELANLKNDEVFDASYIPNKIMMREEANELAKAIGEYAYSGVPNPLLIYGAKGSGKTLIALTLANNVKTNTNTNIFYVNAQENSNSKKIYRKITNMKSKSQSIEEVRDAFDKKIKGKAIIILDEVDFLTDYEILYHVSRYTHADLIMLTSKVFWYKDLADASVRSSLLPEQIYFRDYNSNEIAEILLSRAEDGLNNYDEGSIRLLSASVVKDYASDARMGIEALRLVGRANKWDEEYVKKALKLANKKIEKQSLVNLNDRDLLVLASLINNEDTIYAYNQIRAMDYPAVKGISKSTFFQSSHHLQNLGLITLTKKKLNQTYTMEAPTLLSDPLLVSMELKRRFQDEA